MDHNKDIVAIHDFDIKNQNILILDKVKEVVDDCHNIGILIWEGDEEVVQSAIKIINKDK